MATSRSTTIPAPIRRRRRYESTATAEGVIRPIRADLLRRGYAALAAAAICVLVSIGALAAETAPETLAGSRLLAALKEGGLIVYFRHTSTDFGQNDDQMSGFEDCERQRNLTDSGRAEARQIGAAIKRLEIPIGEVLASPFCRTRETAQLIFGRATVSSAVRGGPANPGSNERYAQLRQLLSTPPSPGSNLAIASHG